MPTVTVDPLPEEALSGLKDPRALLRAFNRLQEECSVLNGKLTVANFSRFILAERELVTPSEWQPLTLENGFTEADTAQFPAAAIRKRADGVVEVRECVKRAAGAPAAFTRIAAIPSDYAPEAGCLRPAIATSSALGSWKVVGQEIQYVSGDPTSQFGFGGGSWVAQDRSRPAWEKPFRLTLNTQSPVQVRKVQVVARAAQFDGYGEPIECTVYGATVTRPTNEAPPVLSIARIDGLQPEQRYKLTLWVFTD